MAWARTERAVAEGVSAVDLQKSAEFQSFQAQEEAISVEFSSVEQRSLPQAELKAVTLLARRG